MRRRCRPTATATSSARPASGGPRAHRIARAGPGELSWKSNALVKRGSGVRVPSPAPAGKQRSEVDAAPAPLKPRLRGVLHQYAFFVAIVLGALLVLRARGPAGTAATAVYALGISGLFGISALYHRVAWGPRAGRWMRRADHSMIFVFI